MQYSWLKKVWGSQRHCAFTDLSEFDGYLYCVFREATNHVSGDGIIRILKLDPEGKLVKADRLAIPHTDLRDPKLSIMPDGKLLLLAYARQQQTDRLPASSQSVCWFSGDGSSWSNMKFILQPYWWLWRIRWHRQQAYGFAYNRSQQRLRLCSGMPRRNFEPLQDEALSLRKHGLGYPNESDILFDEDDNAFALIRRDADTCTAQLGFAKPPYTQWQWHDLGCYVGGPVMQYAGNGKAWVAGRSWRTGHPTTCLWTLDLHSKQMALQDRLPSAGDNSYPGMVLNSNDLTLSYYSSHEGGVSQIYLVRYSM